MAAGPKTTLELIHDAAKAEFLAKGFRAASLRSIVKAAGVTTGAFYGYYASKEELFEALVKDQYEYLMARFRRAQEEFAALPEEEQPEKADIRIGSPVKGKLISLKQVKDEVFATGALGKGAAVIPEKGEVVAPEDCQVSVLYETGHAIGLKLDSGVELLIHIGVDTVNLKGEGFEGLVSVGDRIKAGDALIRFDREDLEKKGYCTDVMLIVMDNDGQFDVKYTTGMTAEAGKTVVAEY